MKRLIIFVALMMFNCYVTDTKTGDGEMNTIKISGLLLPKDVVKENETDLLPSEDGIYYPVSNIAVSTDAFISIYQKRPNSENWYQQGFYIAGNELRISQNVVRETGHQYKIIIITE
jgi:hypothetical protein